MNIVSCTVLITCFFTLLAWYKPALQTYFLGYPYLTRLDGSWYRIFTSGLLHQDFFHLYFNMYALASFGGSDFLHKNFGTFLDILSFQGYREPAALFVLCYFGGILLANFFLYFLYAHDPTYRHLGASAGVCAIMAAAILLNPKMKVSLIYIPIPLPGPIFLAIYLFFSILMLKRKSQISHIAHLVGSFYGLGFILYIAPELALSVFL